MDTDFILEEDYAEDAEDVDEQVIMNESDSNDPSWLDEYEIRKKSYKTPPYLTKYEKTKILAERSQQLTNGAMRFVEGDFTNTYDIALKELQERKLPFILKRPYGNTFEYWKIKDLL